MDSLIYTAGTEGLEPEALAAWATANGSPAILDIRFSPWSRNPAWSMPALLGMMPGYLWLGRCFGNTQYRSPRAEVVLPDPERGLRISARILERGSLVFFCTERDHWTCHRAEVAEMVATATGATIVPLDAADLSAQGRLVL